MICGRFYKRDLTTQMLAQNRQCEQRTRRPRFDNTKRSLTVGFCVGRYLMPIVNRLPIKYYLNPWRRVVTVNEPRNSVPHSLVQAVDKRSGPPFAKVVAARGARRTQGRPHRLSGLPFGQFVSPARGSKWASLDVTLVRMSSALLLQSL